MKLDEKEKSMKLLKKLIEPVIRLIGKKIALKRDRHKVFEHYLAVCGIFRDEAFYLEEWLSFHHQMGVSHFYLYNDRSQDNYMDVLAPWIKKGLVTLTDWHALGQVSAYNHCIKTHRMNARWIAIIDIDEFLFSPKNLRLPEILKEYEESAAIFVFWVLFGSSGHIKRPDKTVIESYTRCLDYDAALKEDYHPKTKKTGLTGKSLHGKSIVNPRLIRVYNIHQPSSYWVGNLVNEKKERLNKIFNEKQKLSYNILRINHYWSKSIDEIVAKVKRGSVNKGVARTLEDWLDRESKLNVTEDKTIQHMLTCIDSSRK
jgi:hypothetical protein